jgi:hypothetical protein
MKKKNRIKKTEKQNKLLRIETLRKLLNQEGQGVLEHQTEMMELSTWIALGTKQRTLSK